MTVGRVVECYVYREYTASHVLVIPLSNQNKIIYLQNALLFTKLMSEHFSVVIISPALVCDCVCKGTYLLGC